jgi:hypothetical protein
MPKIEILGMAARERKRRFNFTMKSPASDARENNQALPSSEIMFTF